MLNRDKNEVISYFDSDDIDKTWFKQISESFKTTVNKRIWLSDQLENFGIYQTNTFAPQTDNPQLHCMSFVYQFFYGQEDFYFCDYSHDLQERIEKFLESPTEISPDKLKTGDMIIYENQKGLTHIAMYVGKINGLDYAVSKLGTGGGGICYHPIQGLPIQYGDPLFFNIPKKLEKEISGVQHKFEKMKQEIAEKFSKKEYENKDSKKFNEQLMEGFGLKLPSGPGRLLGTKTELEDEKVTKSRIYRR